MDDYEKYGCLFLDMNRQDELSYDWETDETRVLSQKGFDPILRISIDRGWPKDIVLDHSVIRVKVLEGSLRIKVYYINKGRFIIDVDECIKKKLKDDGLWKGNEIEGVN